MSAGLFLRSWAFWVLIAIVVLCFAGPSLFGLDPREINLERRLEPPSRAHLLGTDENGRDVLARLFTGGQISLYVGFGAGILGAILGTAVGLIAGWSNRWVSALLMRLTDLAISFPTIMVLLLAASLLGPRPTQLLLIISVTLWMAGARIVRGRVLEVKEAPFVEAAISLGASRPRLMLRHVLPNMQETIAVTTVLAINHAILSESVVSFLGLGVRPPEASWGTMLTNSQSYFFRGFWLILAPGAAIMLTVLATHSLAMRITSRSYNRSASQL